MAEDDEYEQMVGRVRGTALQVDSTYIQGRRRSLRSDVSVWECQNRGVHFDVHVVGRPMVPVLCHAIQSCTYNSSLIPCRAHSMLLCPENQASDSHI